VAFLQSNSAARAEPVLTPQRADAGSTIGSGMLITGSILCAGAVTVHGRVVGDIHAVQLVIAEGGRVDGEIKAQDVTIRGAFKGNLYGGNVKLQGTATVVGEVYNNSLAIEENAMFEGMARRLERSVEAPSLDAANVNSDTTPFVESDALQLVPEQVVAQPSGIDYEVLA
jgi:cytoskeletal protein CcmA (bactofilin family)